MTMVPLSLVHGLFVVMGTLRRDGVRTDARQRYRPAQSAVS